MIHVIRYEKNWGTRQAREHLFIYVSRKPTNEEVIELLRRKLRLDAKVSWLEPQNSGLVSVYPLEVEELDHG